MLVNMAVLPDSGLLELRSNNSHVLSSISVHLSEVSGVPLGTKNTHPVFIIITANDVLGHPLKFLAIVRHEDVRVSSVTLLFSMSVGFVSMPALTIPVAGRPKLFPFPGNQLQTLLRREKFYSRFKNVQIFSYRPLVATVSPSHNSDNDIM